MISNKLPIILFFIVLASMIGALFFLYIKRSTQVSNQTITNYQQQTITPSPIDILHSGSSDQQLTQDNQSIDDSFNSLDVDLHTVDQSLSDQSTNLQ